MKLLGQTTHQNLKLRFGNKPDLSDAARNFCLSWNLPLSQPFKITLSRNPLKFSGVNRAKASNKLQWINSELCSSRFVPSQNVQAHILEQCPLAVIKSMATNVMGSKPYEGQTRKQVFKSASLFLIKYCPSHENVNIYHNVPNQYSHHELKSVLVVITPEGILWPPNSERK